MPSQTEIQKVFKTIIDPMKRTWGVDLDADTIEDFVKCFCNNSDTDLSKAMTSLMRSQKRRPTIAHIIEELRRGKPSGEMSSQHGETYKKLVEEQNRQSSAAFKEVIFVLEGADGQKAKSECYYTELCGHLYDAALSQVVAKKPVYISAPDPIPENWLHLAAYRKEAITRMNGKKTA